MSPNPILPNRSKTLTGTRISRKTTPLARQTLEHAQADLESAKMQVAAAEATVKSVETNLRYSVIYSPFDGTIGGSLVKLGSAVTTGQTVPEHDFLR